MTVEEIQEYFGVKSKKTVENYVGEHDSFDIKNGIVFTIKEKEK